MKRGLVLGKYMPIHKGHVDLIEYALSICDEVIVWLCVSDQETMPANLRFEWVKQTFEKDKRVHPVLFEYDESVFPNSSVSSREVSRIWSTVIKEQLPPIDVIVTSEKYGDYVAEYLQIKHCFFETKRLVSATHIRLQPYKYWEDMVDEVKSYYFKKVCLLGTESTGKSTLTKKLANYFGGDSVAEAGRDIVDDSNECVFEDLSLIAQEHAKAILAKEQAVNRILFVDTDIHITQSYAHFLFDRELKVDDWIVAANRCDLYLYLDNDAPYIQDGTRLSEEDRNRLDASHKQELKKAGIPFILISGNWEERFARAIEEVNAFVSKVK
jgi:HTH-type transcriptional repressor of NAD biosynthesis genes